MKSLIDVHKATNRVDLLIVSAYLGFIFINISLFFHRFKFRMVHKENFINFDHFLILVCISSLISRIDSPSFEI